MERVFKKVTMLMTEEEKSLVKGFLDNYREANGYTVVAAKKPTKIPDLGHKHELNAFVKYALRYFIDNGYDVKLKREYVSKNVYIVSKDGKCLTWDCYMDVANSKKEMQLFQKLWDTCAELNMLKEIAEQ